MGCFSCGGSASVSHSWDKHTLGPPCSCAGADVRSCDAIASTCSLWVSSRSTGLENAVKHSLHVGMATVTFTSQTLTLTEGRGYSNVTGIWGLNEKKDSYFLPAPALSLAVNHLASQQSSIQHSFLPLSGDGAYVTYRWKSPAGSQASSPPTTQCSHKRWNKTTAGNCGGIWAPFLSSFCSFSMLRTRWDILQLCVSGSFLSSPVILQLKVFVKSVKASWAAQVSLCFFFSEAELKFFFLHLKQHRSAQTLVPACVQL